MASLPKNVLQAWEDREEPVIFATVSEDGMPNVNYAVTAGILDDGHLVVADFHFGRTRQNLMRGCKGALLFRDGAGRVYQIKGTVDYHQDGKVLASVQALKSADRALGAARLSVEEVYSVARKP